MSRVTGVVPATSYQVQPNDSLWKIALEAVQTAAAADHKHLTASALNTDTLKEQALIESNPHNQKVLLPALGGSWDGILHIGDVVHIPQATPFGTYEPSSGGKGGAGAPGGPRPTSSSGEPTQVASLDKLTPGTYFLSKDGKYELTLNKNGSLVLTENTVDGKGNGVSIQVWHTGPNPKVHGVSVHQNEFGKYGLLLDDGNPIEMLNPDLFLVQNAHLSAFLNDIMS
jgi:hypothetical protein